MAITYEELRDAVKTGAALRSRTKLQPAGGEGDKVFPPTYADAVYAMEWRKVPDSDAPVRCVLMDSVQSSANRMEEALQDAVDEGRIAIPVVEVDFSELPIVDPKSDDPGLFEPIGRVTSLEAPHRVADAILRDSELDGIDFRNSEEGKKINLATLRNATPLLELCPTALVFGIWDSTGPKGGLGVKFQRAIVSEIIGIDAAIGCKTSSRIDPLGIRKEAATIYETPERSWTLDPKLAATDKKKKNPILKGKDGKPSEANHGNIPPDISKKGYDPLGEGREKVYLAGGVTLSYAEQTTVLSFPALRRLRFPLDGDSKANRDRDLAAQTALAALAICGAVLAAERGLDLRSRCLLWPTQNMKWELLGKPGETSEPFEISADEAVDLLDEAVKKLNDAKLPWRSETLTLKPSAKLIELIRKSQELAITSEGGND